MRRASLTAAVLVLLSCGAKESQGPVRLALIPAENQSADASIDWVSSAIPLLLASQLEGLPNLTIVRTASRGDAASSGAAPVFCQYRTSLERLVIECWRDGSGRTVRAEGPHSAGIAAIAGPLAAGLYADARPAPPVSDAALQAYARRDYLEAARLAPDFGYFYADGASASILGGNRTVADRLIAEGMARGNAIGDISRARLQLASGATSINLGDQVAALGQLTALIPGDADLWTRYAQVLSAEHKPAEAAAAQRKVTALQPDNPAAWNQLGYLSAWSGDATGAKAAIAEYERLSPQSPNAADSLGEVCYYTGRFEEAEKAFLRSMSIDPTFMGGQGYFKAAMARLRLGDPAGASAHFLKFAERNGPAKDILLAQWAYIIEGATVQMEQVAKSSPPDIAAIAQAQIALWKRIKGDKAAAEASARVALFSARNPLSRAAAQNALLVTLPPADAAGWNERLAKMIPAPEQQSLRRTLAMQVMIAQGDFAGALPLARKSFERAAPPEDRTARIFTAWCLAETGAASDAAQLLEVNPVPQSPLASLFESVLIRKELELRTKLKGS